MRIVYKVMFDLEYCHAVVKHYYAQRPLILRPQMQTLLYILISVVFLWQSRLRSNPSAVNIHFFVNSFIASSAIAVIAVLITRWAIVQRLKSNAEFGHQITVTLTEDGVEGIGERVSGKWSWAAYPRSVRFSDGILLLRAGVIRWLPDDAIKVGTSKEATALVDSKSELRTLTNV